MEYERRPISSSPPPGLQRPGMEMLSLTGRIAPYQRVLGVVLMGLLLLLALVDPVLLLYFGGLLSAAGLAVLRPQPDSLKMPLILALFAMAWMFGGPLSGLAVAACLAVSLAYLLWGRLPKREADHFFLPSLLFWMVLVLGYGMLRLLLPGAADAAIEPVRSMLEVTVGEVVPQFQAALSNRGASPEDAQLFLRNPAAWFIGLMLAVHALVGYGAVKWVRARTMGIHPIWGRFILFRIGVFYAPVVVLVLVLAVLSRFASQWDLLLERFAILLGVWFSSGCLLAGLACCGFMVVTMRLSGRTMMARFYLMGMIVVAVLAWFGFVFLGLLDIWFDMRRLSFAKSMFIGKGDSRK